jgi:hypothetical protein
MREIRMSGSVGAPGERSSGATRQRLNGMVDSPFELFDALGLMIDLHDVVEQDSVLLGVWQLQVTHPLPPGCGPGSAAIARSLTVTQ